MLNTIIIVATSMVIVAFGGIGYNFMFDTVYGAYPSWLDVYVIFASGVGLGVCIVALYDQLVYEYFEDK